VFLLAGAFNPVEHLYDRASAWVSLWGVHGAEFVNKWNETMPKFMALSQHSIMMMVAAAICILSVSYVTYARNSRIPRGLRNFIEPLVLFVRNEIARPNIKNPHSAHGHGHDTHDHEHGAKDIAAETTAGTKAELHGDGHGHHDANDHGHAHPSTGSGQAAKENPHSMADKFAPILCCSFFFIATVNLIGLIPGSTTATSAITVTLGLAVLTFLTYLVGAVVLQGPKAFIVNLVPYHFSTKPLDMGIWFLLLGIEFIGMLAKPFALTVRLFANMTAGHCIILSLLFINQLVHTGAPGTYWPIATGVPTVLMSAAIYGLEIFVAILQAYIFTYLSAIFIGSYLVPEH
jgi:ATP synthase subunit 6